MVCANGWFRDGEEKAESRVEVERKWGGGGRAQSLAGKAMSLIS